MADERQELDRLRKIKRLRELESREVQSGNIPNVGLDLPSGNGVTSQTQQQGVEPSFLSSVGEFFTGSDRETRATRELPDAFQCLSETSGCDRKPSQGDRGIILS